jgi:hypothetical protein
MDLARAWVAAAVVYLVGSAVTVYIALAGNKVGQGGLSTGSAIVWNAVPALVIFTLMAVFSGILHTGPRADNPTRHALALLSVPAVLTVVGIAIAPFQDTPFVAVVAGALASVIGTLAGWAVDRWRRGRRQKTAAERSEHGYY